MDSRKGIILYTKDGGGHWEAQKAPLRTNLLALDSIDTQRAWAVGEKGKVIYTTDGGKLWREKESGVSVDLKAVEFTDSRHGWICGGIILHTKDAGESWQRGVYEKELAFNAIYFVDSQRGWLIGQKGTILHTDNGGKGWKRQKSGVEASLFGIDFVDSMMGVVSGEGGTILRTMNGGKSWEKLDTGFFAEDFHDIAFTPPYFPKVTGTKLYPKGAKIYAVGRGAMINSYNQGKTWQIGNITLPFELSNTWLSSITYRTRTDVWTVGEKGCILRSKDAGNLWEEILVVEETTKK